jgi:RNA chaperone Hfq
MSQYKSQVQNQFLSQIRKKHQKVEVILETGNVLRGKLKAYDQFSVTLSFKDSVEVIYKSSIIYITPIPLAPEKKPLRRPYSPYPKAYDSQRQEEYRPRPKQAPQFFENEPDSDEEYTEIEPEIIEDQELDPPPPKKANRKI